MKKKLYTQFTYLIFCSVLVASCTNDEYNTPDLQNTIDVEMPFESIKMDENGQLKMKFAESLANALLANKDLRRLVKEEALKQFDKDYDVMYQLVKNKSLMPTDYNGISNGKVAKSTLITSSQATTFRQALLPFFKNEAELIEIEQKLPLLSIFVPELPLGYFSAETWDVNDENQVPDVAFRLNTTNDVPVIGKDGKNYVIEAALTPGFPIIVIKENERMRVKQNKYSVSKNSKQAYVGFSDFEYLDDNFDPNASVNNPPIVNNSGIDQILIDSYNVWEGYGPGGWQRDNIYYGLTPTKQSGAINGGKYREHITSFKLSGNDPTVAFNGIANIEDPQQVTDYRLGDSSGWTDGNFEFLIYCYYGAKASNLGASDTKGFSAKPSDLFELKYEAYSRFNWPFKKTYIRTTIITSKTINFLNNNYGTLLQFQTWDLNRFANEWKFSFEEVDDPLEITDQQVISQKFNTNLNLDTTLGEIVKVGLKFGVSFEESKSNTYTIKKTTKSNNLFDVVIPFYDNVVNKDPNIGQIVPRIYYTGKVEFAIRPIQVQW
ncbi:hypothetical protein IWX84_002897 [Flavobacterium sp. CG_9.10]|uniref:hypothetical protein n=1 Tax=Flavobacterium sp. CG_9.10 TaxID=2787729 RepID=UPI0018C9496C|nr:hypothetical protein [Flavobacterium sp. CG_9.10]MBG6112002.1 hypothetical protein [Flavobacterium sp. CG_9.10]